MSISIAVIVLVVIFNICAAKSLKGNFVPAVTNFDLTKYVGLWYQVYADSFVTQTFEKDSFCVTATYGAKSDGTVSVHNYARIGSPTGSEYLIDGYAYVPDSTQPAELLVNFPSVGNFDAPYWVIELGPINADGLYDYAIVSDNVDISLFVLARDVNTFYDKYNTQVLQNLKQYGFTGFKQPLKTYQGTDCLYESAATSTALPATSSIVKGHDVVPAVTELDVNKYAGLWYQMYADAFVVDTFERDSYCVTATYGLNTDGTISVHNYATKNSPSGTTYIIDGYAYVPDATQPGELLVHFPTVGNFDGPYWIIELGPVNKDGLYDWAIVSDNLDVSLYVLARDVNTFMTKYDKQVQLKLVQYGFTGARAPIATYQGTDCVYEKSAVKAKGFEPVPAVSTLDVSKYLGLWYQVFADAFVVDTTEKDAYCATALYGANSDGTISVHNYAKIGAANGTDYIIDGSATQPDASKPGQLLVEFPSVGSFAAPYWILSLGPVNSDGLYDWAIVSDNLDVSLFVLARNVETYFSLYNDKVQQELASFGFTGVRKPVALYQGKDCIYEK